MIPRLTLIRFGNFSNRTLGKFIFDQSSWYSIENPWQNNTPFLSCIPEGNYRMVRVNSPKYGDHMWEISEVHDRTSILVHVANTAVDVTGCIGLGTGLYGNL